MDRDGAKLVLRGMKKQYPSILHVWWDAAYECGKLKEYTQKRGWTIEIIRRPRGGFWVRKEDLPFIVIEKPKFEIMPRRWVIERTFGWFSRYRRLSKDYEFSPDTSENMIYLAMIRNMLKRLTHRYRRF